jgi:alpha-1,2-mannosyltransferase
MSGGSPAGGRLSFRHDDGVGAPTRQANARLLGWARVERAWWLILGGAMLVFSAFPIANLALGYATKDYGLWYQVGLAVRMGLDVYPRPETGRLFPFMYPPSAAAMLAWVSMLGRTGSLLALVLVNSAAWLASIALSVWLAVKPGERRHPLVVILPSLAIIVLVHNIYLLGQPNLLLLALLLGAFACLQRGHQIGAGALVATAAAIKAFPIMALGYLIYRRMWAASAATVAVLAAWLLIAPLPFRTPVQAVDDVVVWSKGMLFTYNSYGIAQRPFRSYSYKNQSIMALSHRLLRDVPADGEAILSRRAKEAYGSARPIKGIAPIDPSTDLLTFLKPHAQTSPDSTQTKNAQAGHLPAIGAHIEDGGTTTANADRFPRWDDALQGALPALRNAWRVNLLDLSFRSVTAVTLAAIVGLCLFVVAMLPRSSRRTRQTDAIEYAIVILLTVMFSPLSFNYAYVWLIYPMTIGLHLVISEPSVAPAHRIKIAWIAAVFLIPALAIPVPLLAQAYGNLFVPALLLLFGLGAMLHKAGSALPDQASADSSYSRHGDRLARATAIAPAGPT